MKHSKPALYWPNDTTDPSLVKTSMVCQLWSSLVDGHEKESVVRRDLLYHWATAKQV